ncbi:MAG: PadR family transcriptional regulator [Chloroflexota bacterium]
MKSHDRAAPLTPAVFHILLALAPGEKHGYEMMKQVTDDSQGHVSMGSGTLYGSIKRMVTSGLIEEAGERPDPAVDDQRRRYYRLTAEGRSTLLAEVRRYQGVALLAGGRVLSAGSELDVAL